LFALIVAVASWLWLPLGGRDWHNDIGPGARRWWPDPWTEGLPLAPWAALILSPLGGIPDRVATAFTNGLSVIILALVAKRFNGPDWIAIPILISPPGWWLFTNGQTEWLMLSGLLMFNGLDILLVVLKPQVAVGVIVPRVRRAGARWFVYLAPALLFGLASFIIWPGWPLRILEFAPILIKGEWNSALWPWGLPVGLFLLWQAWRTGEDRWGIAASPFLFPYVNMPSYLGLLIVLAARWPRWTLGVWVAMWLFGFLLIFLNR
jgi:hypothetical protein